MEFEFAAEEEDADSLVVEVSEAAGCGFQILNPAIESLSYSISDVVGKVANRGKHGDVLVRELQS